MKNNRLSYAISLIMLYYCMINQCTSISPDNACTFHIGGRLFSLIYLQKQTPHNLTINQSAYAYIQFCSPITPNQCETKSAYSFIITSQYSQNKDQVDNQTISNQIVHTCSRYSSNSYSSFFRATYTKIDNLGELQYTQQTQGGKQSLRKTVYVIQCSDDNQLQIKEFKVNDSTILIKAKSRYGCPVFEVSSIWKVFDQNWILIGIILILLGLHLLFFGRVTIQTTIFITAFLITFAVLGAILTVFVGPYSSTFIIYFAFLMLLFTATMLAYGVTKLMGISIFFVGAVLGFIIGMLLNSLFCRIFNLYSVWSLVIFQIILIIPFGLLSFKYTNQIIIASSSLTGAYFIIRPISWAFGGFPNQFLLYQMIQTNQLKGLPWPFFLYLIVIVALAIVGAMYQFIKLQRQNPNNQIQINFIQENIEQPIDQIKMKVDKLIEKFREDPTDNQYHKLSELKQGPKISQRQLEGQQQKKDKNLSIHSQIQNIENVDKVIVEKDVKKNDIQNF